MKTAREYLCDALGVDDRRLGELLQNEYRPPEPYLPDILKAMIKYGLDVREEAAKELKAAQRLCQIYFDIAADAIGDKNVRAERDEKLNSLPLGD